MKSQTLLQKAISVKSEVAGVPEKCDKQEGIELALAWLDGRVRLKQVAVALGVHPSRSYAIMAMFLRLAYRQGSLTISK